MRWSATMEWNRRVIGGLKTLGAILAFVSAFMPAAAHAQGRKPNILVIMGDDIEKAAAAATRRLGEPVRRPQRGQCKQPGLAKFRASGLHFTAHGGIGP